MPFGKGNQGYNRAGFFTRPIHIIIMEAFLVSTGIVALAEIGDKTQLLSLLLAVRYKRPWTIIAAIFISTILNHALAAALGAWIAHLVGGECVTLDTRYLFHRNGRMDNGSGQAG